MNKLFVLGRLDLTSDDPTLADEILSKSSPTALLIYLAVEKPGTFHRRDSLVTLFWPETDQKHALTNLRKLIHTLTKKLGEAFETRGDHDVRIDPAQLWCDAAEFQKSLGERRLARAVELYRGALAPGFFLNSAGGGFERWLDDRRGFFAREAVTAVIKLAEASIENSESTAASDLVRSIDRLGTEIDDERQLRKLLELLLRLGDRLGALRLCEKFRERLWREFQTKPSAETLALCEKIRAG